MKQRLADMIKSINQSSVKVTSWVGLILLLCVASLQYCLNGDHVNRDGVLYLFQAYAVNAGDFNGARDLYPNVIFAQLIAFLQSSMSLTYTTAAHVIGLIFFMVSSLFFLKILKLISSDPLLMICGVIILLTSLALDKYLVMILRDHALWAGLMTMTYYFIRWSQEQRVFYLLLSLGSVALAGLFRSEALSLIPVLLFLVAWMIYRERQDCSFLKSFIVTGLLISLIGVGLFLMGGTHFSYARIDELVHLTTGAITNISQPLPIHTNNYWLAELLKDHPLLMKFSFFTSLILYKWMTVVGLIGLFLLAQGLSAKTIQVHPNTRLFFFSMLIVTMVWPILNLFSTNVISNRYLVPQLWLLKIFMAIGLYEIITSSLFRHNKSLNAFSFVVIFLFFIKFLDVIIDTRRPTLDKQVANWALDNKITLNEAFVPNLRVRYYMNNLTLPSQEISGALKNNNIIWFIVDNPLAENVAQSLTMIKSFPDQESPRKFIYQREHSD
jgi:hypothetical protein